MRGPLIGFSANPQDRHAGMALARYIETLLLAASAGWSGIEIRECAPGTAGPAESLAATAAGGSLPCPVVSLDLAAAAAMAHARQHLLLRDAGPALSAVLSVAEGPDLALTMLRLLRHAESLVVFGTGPADLLRQLGCRVGAVAPLPALPPATPAIPAGPRSVLVVNHLDTPQAAAPAVALLRRVVGETALLGVAEAPAPGLDAVPPWHAGHPNHALAHVHIGLPPADGGACRLVDSFACRRPVLLHLPGGLAGAGTLPIAHESEGLVTTGDSDLVGAMTTLLEDQVFSGILVRNAERRLHAFNQDCAGVLRAAVPELFA